LARITGKFETGKNGGKKCSWTLNGGVAVAASAALDVEFLANGVMPSAKDVKPLIGSVAGGERGNFG